MNKNSLFPKAFVVFLCLMSVALGDRNVSVKNFRIIRQCPPWREVKGSFRPFDAKYLFNLIDGGAPEYIEQGLVRGIFQRLSSPDSATLEIFVEDFGTPDHANKMFEQKRKNAAGPCLSAGLDSTAFCCTTVIGGFAVCGMLNRFYFEFVLMGMKENEKAYNVIALIYNHFRTTAGGLKIAR